MLLIVVPIGLAKRKDGAVACDLDITPDLVSKKLTMLTMQFCASRATVRTRAAALPA